MGFADFSQFVVTTADETVCETSTLKVRALSPHLPATSTGTSDNLLDFIVFRRLIRISQPYMRFLFVGDYSGAPEPVNPIFRATLSAWQSHSE